MSDISAKIISIESADETFKKITPSIPQSKQAVTNERPSTTGLTFLIWIGALLWIAGVITTSYFTFGPWENLSTLTPLQWFDIAALVILPVLMLITLGLLAKRLIALSQHSHALIDAADALTRPDLLAGERAENLASTIRSQIIGVDSEFKTALDRLAGMENVLTGHTDALTSSHIAASRQTGEIAQRLSEEREGLKEISTSFDERMGALSRLLTEHSDRLSHATHIAEQKIQEARVSVEGAAAKINASSEIVRENALSATQTLGASHDSIIGLGNNIKTQSAIMDEISARHTAELGILIERMESEQMRMNETLQARLDSMRDMSLSAKLSADSLTEASNAGRDTISALGKAATLADEAVKQRFSEMEDMVRFSNNKAESITDRAAKRVRDSLTLTRLEISRIEDDMRELEQRMTDNAGGFDRREPALDVTPKSNWRKSLLRFRPAEDEAIIDVEPETHIEEQTPATLVLTPPPSIPLSEQIAPLLEPEIETLEIPHPGTTQKTKQAKPVKITAPVEIPARRMEDNLTLETPEPAQFDLPSVEPLAAPIATPNLSASRIDPPQLRARKEKSGWLSGLFGGKNEGPKVKTSVLGWPQLCDDVDARLSAIGLAPNAVVEAGLHYRSGKCTR